MGKKAIKRRRAKFAKRVLAGKMTVTEARARLGRGVAQKSYGSAWSTWPVTPVPAPAFQPGMDRDEYLLSAVRAPITVPAAAAAVVKARKAKKTPEEKQYDRNMAPVREFIAKASRPAAFSLATAPAPGSAVRQLTQPERAMVAELRRELACVAHIPARREEVSARILQITGDPFTPGVL